MAEFSVIGREIVLHRVSFPQNMRENSKPDVFISVKIIETKEVPNFSGRGKDLGWRAVGEDGRYYTSNWTSFPDDSASPRWMWHLDEPFVPSRDKDNVEDWIWYDVTQGMPFIPFKPGWVDRYSFLGYCSKHQGLFYAEDKCFYCEHVPGYEPPVDYSWKGWK